jgi:hypothetical protein
MASRQEPPIPSRQGKVAGFHVESDSESNFNRDAGFFFGGKGKNTLINPKARGNPTGIVVRDNAKIRVYNPDIE